MKIVSVFVRLLALSLCVVCFKQAWAGIWTYQGSRQLSEGNYESAVEHLKKAHTMDPGNPHVDDLLGRSLWYAALRAPESSDFNEPALYFQKLTEKIPNYGKGWLYRGLSTLEAQKRAQGGLTEGKWGSLKHYFKKANRLAPSNAWVTFLSGKALLSQSEWLTEEEGRRALLKIKQSILRHQPNPNYAQMDKGSPFLKSAFQLIWDRTHDFAKIQMITPRNRASYKQLVEWMRFDDTGIYYAEVYQDYLDYQATEYAKECTKGERLLREGQYEEAFHAYRKAFWSRSWAYPRAKAGILVSDHQRGIFSSQKHALLQLTPAEILRDILEDEEEDIGVLMEALSPLVKATEDPYLMGLYAFRKGRFFKAVEHLERVPPKNATAKRYLAGAYAKTGDRDRAITLLTPEMQATSPDYRNLYDLKMWKAIPVDWINRKLEEMEIRHYSPQRWWGGDGHQLQKPGEKRTMTLNLKPGESEVRVFVRSLPSSGEIYGFIRVKLNGKPLYGDYVNRKAWVVLSLPVKTTGGKRWLEVEYLQTQHLKNETAPAIELGPVRVNDE